ncbi:MAG: ZIP family metal transporter [Actinomycetaceae bacterium]|nr:ZIP family metal transporter [Actinomycetaceae bacterium]
MLNDSNFVYGILIPFLGTTLGSALVFFMKNNIPRIVERGIYGFASGVMVAAAVWSLILPALEYSEESSGGSSVFLVAGGFLFGTFLLLFLDHVIPHQHLNSKDDEGPSTHLTKNAKLALAVTLHNVPEGMAVAVSYVAFTRTFSDNVSLSLMPLVIGIAVQNIPEGTIISLSDRLSGKSKLHAFGMGVASGAVEPIAFLLTVIASSFVLSILPFLLAAAAGAMIYVVIEELVPDMAQGKHSDIGPIMFAIGFSLMMVLDVAFG